MPKDRRDVIADAALHLIGSEGARGLTHRGVDSAAGLPEGSTSYYCRRRADLLALALQRHADLDRRALSALDMQLSKEGAPLAELAKGLSFQLTRWMNAQSREQLAARFELFLACSREPLLKGAVEAQREQFLSVLAARLKARAVARPRGVATALIALIEGLLLERVRLGRAALGARELRELMMALLTASAGVRTPAPHQRGRA